MFLLEIPEGISFSNQDLRKNTGHLRSTQLLFFKGFHLKRKSPQGDLKQETSHKRPVLLKADSLASPTWDSL